MLQRLEAVTVLVPSYNDGLALFRNVLGFAVLEDTPIFRRKRWIVVTRREVRALRRCLPLRNDRQKVRMGDQAGGRVGFFLHPRDFWTDYENPLKRGVKFLETPRRKPHGLVVVFAGPGGGKWDLLQTISPGARDAMRFDR